MQTVADKREGGGQKSRKFANVLNGWSQSWADSQLNISSAADLDLTDNSGRLLQLIFGCQPINFSFVGPPLLISIFLVTLLTNQAVHKSIVESGS